MVDPGLPAPGASVETDQMDRFEVMPVNGEPVQHRSRRPGQRDRDLLAGNDGASKQQVPTVRVKRVDVLALA